MRRTSLFSNRRLHFCKALLFRKYLPHVSAEVPSWRATKKGDLRIYWNHAHNREIFYGNFSKLTNSPQQLLSCDYISVRPARKQNFSCTNYYIKKDEKSDFIAIQLPLYCSSNVMLYRCVVFFNKSGAFQSKSGDREIGRSVHYYKKSRDLPPNRRRQALHRAFGRRANVSSTRDASTYLLCSPTNMCLTESILRNYLIANRGS